MKRRILLIFILFLVVFACRETITHPGDELLQTGADTLSSMITYDVVIKNPDAEDVWMTECLKDLKREELIDIIFEGIYNEKLTAYDIFEDNKISPSKLRKMEDEGLINREQIGKFQFVEAWFFDKVNMTMTKRVIEIRLGTESFSSDGIMVGYEPLLKVSLN